MDRRRAASALREIHRIIERDREDDAHARKFAAAATGVGLSCFFGWILYIIVSHRLSKPTGPPLDSGFMGTVIFLTVVPAMLAYYFGSSPRPSGLRVFLVGSCIWILMYGACVYFVP
jgi:drug/metabolite transporter (DMT)-like permease